MPEGDPRWTWQIVRFWTASRAQLLTLAGSDGVPHTCRDVASFAEFTALDYAGGRVWRGEARDYANRWLDEITDSCTVEARRCGEKKRKIDTTSAKCEVAHS